MRVSTPLADVDMTIGSLTVRDGALVLENDPGDAIRTRTVMSPADVRRLFGAILRPGVLWFAFTCLFRRGETSAAPRSSDDNHPTPNPW